jgi:hypothetical protein
MESTSDDRAVDWRRRVEAQQAGGQTVRAWCQANGVREHGFYWWRARLGLSPAARGAAGTTRAKARVAGLARVVVAASLAEGARLRLGGGRELLLPPSMPIGHLAELVRAIEGLT